MLGKVKSKSWINYEEIAAVSISLISLVVAILTVEPSVKLSWLLGFKKQIIIIGALLNIQHLCLKKVVPTSFSLLEARFGKSILQNYNVILRRKCFGKHASRTWKYIFIILTFLPTALSISYKQFLDGTSPWTYKDGKFSDTQYSFAYPNLGQYASLNIPIYLSMNANGGFLNASRSDQAYPSQAEYPLKYSYNTLVISEDSAAMLDMPLAESINYFQGRLTLNETWQVSAAVDAIVATRNTSIANLRHDQGFLNQTMLHSYDGFASQSLFQNETGLGFGWMSVGVPEVTDVYCLMGSFGNHSLRAPSPLYKTRDVSDDSFLSFMESAQMFSIARTNCTATWTITQSDVRLVQGECFNASSSAVAGNVRRPSPGFLHQGQTNPFAFDALPVLANTIGVFSTLRPASPWKQVSYAVAAANTWWARSAFLKYSPVDNGATFNPYPETQYSSRQQRIVSTKQTLHASWGLYFVLGVFPLLTVLVYIPSVVLYSMPLGKGFGLVSILAGMERDSLDLLRGAGLSGSLTKPVRLDVSSEQVVKSGEDAEERYRIRYVLSEELVQRSNTKIEHGRKYE